MASAAFNPDEGASRPFKEAEPLLRPLRTPSPSLLDQVLQETLAMASPDPSLKPEELDAMIGVARRYGPGALSLDAVADLVQTVLHMRFRCLSDARDMMSRMSREIAGTMRDDPQTWQRIETFWARLREASQ